MNVLVTVQKGSYHDSARLMAIARQMKSLSGIIEAVVMMGTEANRSLLEEAGFEDPAIRAASPLDMIVALKGEGPQQLEEAMRSLKTLLEGPTEARRKEGGGSLRFGEALARFPAANVVSIAVPGLYAAFLAHKTLDAGRNVFLFSDNVLLKDEVVLKERARELGLLVMGPDCGTAILGGVGLGFANRVRRGPVGIVGASGTGIQEICSLLDQHQTGISHAIGTGSRDLSQATGGAMTEMGLRLLAGDTATSVIVVVAKHPEESVARRLENIMQETGKPVFVRYLGMSAPPSRGGVRYARSLDEAALWTVSAVTGHEVLPAISETRDIEAGGRPPAGSGARLVGLFGGGSLASEAKYCLEMSGITAVTPEDPVWPGKPLPAGHLVIDTGDDCYTSGKPHPMVDQTVRCDLIRTIGSDASVGILLLDLVLGDGSHPDPAPEIASAVSDARKKRTVPLIAICSVTGTAADPQDTARQKSALTAAGIHVETSALRAALMAVQYLPQDSSRRRS